MRSIILKDLLQAKLGILFAVAVALGLFVLHGGDHDLIFGINFGVIAPLFMWIISYYSITQEKIQGTYDFLMGLPMNRKKIWLSKAIAALLSGITCYLILWLISITAGMKPMPETYEVFDIELSPYHLFFLLPLFAWAMGMLGTVLHEIISAVSTILIVLVAGFQVFRFELLAGSQNVARTNWTPYLSLAIILFLASSFIHFSRQSQPVGKKLAWYSTAHLLGIILIFSLSTLSLNTYNEWANRNIMPYFYLSLMPTSQKGSYLLFADGKTSNFDLIDNRDSFDLRLFNSQKAKAVPIAKRNFGNFAISPSLKYALYDTSLGMLAPGKAELVLQNLVDGSEIVIDSYASPLGFTSQDMPVYNRIAYANQPEKQISRNLLFETGQPMVQSLWVFNRVNHQAKLLATFTPDTDFFSNFNASYSVIIAKNRNNLWFIDPNIPVVSKLDLGIENLRSYYISMDYKEHENLILRASRRDDYEKKTYFLISPQGKVKDLGITDGRLICSQRDGLSLFYRAYDNLGENSEIFFNSPETGEKTWRTKEMHISSACFSRSGRYLATLGWIKSEKPTKWIFEITDLHDMNKTWRLDHIPVSIWPYNEDSFEFRAGNEVFRCESPDFSKAQRIFNVQMVMGREETDVKN